MNPPTTAPSAQTNELPIADLRDIILPETVTSYWLAPGWIIIMVLIVIIALGLFVFWKRRQQKNLYKSDAQVLLNDWLAKDSESASVTPSQLAELSALLKRVAMHNNDRSHIASLYGQHWAHFLDRSAPGSFTAETVELITQGEYQSQLSTEVTRREIYNQCLRWVQTSKPMTITGPGNSHVAV